MRKMKFFFLNIHIVIRFMCNEAKLKINLNGFNNKYFKRMRLTLETTLR